MKKHKYISIALILIFFVLPSALHAASLSLTTRSLGGRVSQDPSSLSTQIVCSATYGPFMMTPFNLAVPGPFFIRSAITGTPRLSGYLLGNYTIIPDLGTCYNPQTGVPIPAFEIKMYGVSQ